MKKNIEYKIDFFEISNKERTNVEEAGLCIVNKILEKKQRDSLVDYNSSHSLTKLSRSSAQQDDSKRCCWGEV